MQMNPYMNMNIVDRDLYLIHIENEIEIKRNMLLEKQKKLEHHSKQNHFLEMVKQDYQKYHQTIMQQKQDQLKALELLNQYIHDLTISGKLSKQNIKDSHYEQKKILHEIKKIKKGVDELTTKFQPIVATMEKIPSSSKIPFPVLEKDTIQVKGGVKTN